ncbi:recombinase family protein [bacterium]|nr:recombinase family protein [bacterium]
MKQVAIYARVSTLDQDPENQLRELRSYVERRGWTLVGEFVDRGVSGAKDRRPALDRLISDARKRKIDCIAVWALDRLGRSLRHLVNLVADFEALGVDLVAYTQPIDTTTPAGKLTFQVLGAVAEFERSMIRERVRAGVAKAKASGKRLGRPRAAIDLAGARQRIEGGESLRSVARSLGTNHVTLRRALRRGTESPAPAA